jgi:TDG/mug DNA glycosylase family protein
MTEPWKPTPKQLSAARDKQVPDLIGPGLKVLFVGINPGLYSAAVGHHFGRPGNRFWPALHRGGFTPRQLSPFDEEELLPLGLGITNVGSRATARADELTPEELVAGARVLKRKIARYRPGWVTFLGVGAFRTGFNRPHAVIGLQEKRLGSARVWVLPSPSGLNAHYRLPQLARLFRQFHKAAWATKPRGRPCRKKRSPSC